MYWCPSQWSCELKSRMCESVTWESVAEHWCSLMRGRYHRVVVVSSKINKTHTNKIWITHLQLSVYLCKYQIYKFLNIFPGWVHTIQRSYNQSNRGGRRSGWGCWVLRAGESVECNDGGWRSGRWGEQIRAAKHKPATAEKVSIVWDVAWKSDGRLQRKTQSEFLSITISF